MNPEAVGRLLLALLVVVLLALQVVQKDEVDATALSLLGGLLLLLVLPKLLELTGFGITVKLRDEAAQTEEERKLETAGALDSADEDEQDGTRLPQATFARAARWPREAVAAGALSMRKRLLLIDRNLLGRSLAIGHPGVAAELQRRSLLSDGATHLVTHALANAEQLCAQAEVTPGQAAEALRYLDRAYAVVTPRLVLQRAVKRELAERYGEVEEARRDPKELSDLVVHHAGVTARVAVRAVTVRNSAWLRRTAAKLGELGDDTVHVVVVPPVTLSVDEPVSERAGVTVVRLDALEQDGLPGLSPADPLRLQR